MGKGLTSNGYWIAHYRSHITNHRLRITDHTLPIADRDTRESSVREMVKELKEFGVEAYGYDHLLSKEEMDGFGVKALDNLDVKIKMDCVIMAVAHDEFKRVKLEDVKKFMNAKPVLIDVRGMFDEEEGKGFYYRCV
jgi:UDP-N-acetyl-D-galactosamine dehydrogenase